MKDDCVHTDTPTRLAQPMPRGLFATPLWLIVKFYKLAISPVLSLLPNSGCRFYPTCSEYAMDAIAHHGAFKGFVLALCRILRCQPFCNGGLDFVPKKFQWRKLFSQNKVDEWRTLDN